MKNVKLTIDEHVMINPTRIAHWLACGVLLVLVGANAGRCAASSHREAPIIAEDPAADNTDVYAFVSPNDPDKFTMIANCVPLTEPGGGPNFVRFSDDVAYQIHVDNDGDCMEDITYEFNFSTSVNYGDSSRFILGPLDGTLDNYNVLQRYNVSRVTLGGTENLVTGAPVSPPNIGPRSNIDIEASILSAVQTLGSRKVFAGLLDDPFFFDLGSIFDLVSIRQPPGNSGGGIDGLRGYNVSAIAVEVPITELTANGQIPPGPGDPDGIISCWASAKRQQITTRQPGGETQDSGPYIQTSRVGMPLVNMLISPIGDRDAYNRRGPDTDFALSTFLQFSDLPSILAERLGTTAPFPPRDDIVDFVYHSNQTPASCVGDVLRIDLGIPPADNPHRLGQAAGDMAGFPNGRRPLDDVTDVLVSVLVGDTGGNFGDGVDSNDVPYLTEFPYLGVPHEGFDHTHAHAATR